MFGGHLRDGRANFLIMGKSRRRIELFCLAMELGGVRIGFVISIFLSASLFTWRTPDWMVGDFTDFQKDESQEGLL